MTASLKRIIKNILCHPLMARLILLLFSGSMPNIRYRNMRFVVPVNHTEKRVVATLFWGFYEAAEIRLINQLLPTGCDVVELGSSIGVVASFIARKVQRPNKMISVEANPYLINYINENIMNNSPDVRARILNKAIAYGKDEVKFKIARNHTSSLIGTADDDDNQMVAVQTISLSKILEDNEIGDYCLISDIEGAEYEVLVNDKQAFERCNQIIIELHNGTSSNNGQHIERSFTVDELADMITELGFRQTQRDGHVFCFEK